MNTHAKRDTAILLVIVLAFFGYGLWHATHAPALGTIVRAHGLEKMPVAHHWTTARASTFGGAGEYQPTRCGNTQRLNAHHVSYVAHRTLPIGTILEIRYHGRTIRAIVADRGPAKRTGKSLDIGTYAAKLLRYESGSVKWRKVGRLRKHLTSPWWIRRACGRR